MRIEKNTEGPGYLVDGVQKNVGGYVVTIDGQSIQGICEGADDVEGWALVIIKAGKYPGEYILHRDGVPRVVKIKGEVKIVVPGAS